MASSRDMHLAAWNGGVNSVKHSMASTKPPKLYEHPSRCQLTYRSVLVSQVGFCNLLGIEKVNPTFRPQSRMSERRIARINLMATRNVGMILAGYLEELDVSIRDIFRSRRDGQCRSFLSRAISVVPIDVPNIPLLYVVQSR
jgi:hypothetical protein